MADLIQSLAQIGQFSSLPLGWDYGRGGPSTVATCSRARTILTTLYGLGLRRFDVAPGREGGITVAAIKTVGNVIEIHCDPHGSYDLYVTSDDQDLVDLSRIGFIALLEELRGIAWLSTKSSIWSIPNVICRTWEDSQVSLSRTHQTAPASRLYVCNAPSRGAAASVHIYNNTQEQVSAEILQYFGDSDTRNLQTA